MIKKWLSPHTLKWWQVGILKVTMLALGILVGSYWSELFEGWTVALMSIFIVGSLYLVYIWHKGLEETI